MRTIATLISLSLFAPVALAAPGDAPSAAPTTPTAAAPPTAQPTTPAFHLTPINLTETPERCHPIAKRAIAVSLVQALSARISLASCIADARFSELPLIDGQESITAMDEAAAPSLAMLDEVAAATDPVTQVMATHAKAQLLQTMMNRMTQTVSVSADARPEAQALRETRRAIMQELLTPWRERTLAIHAAIDELGRTHPTLVRNPVALAAIRDSRERLARPVASR